MDEYWRNTCSILQIQKSVIVQKIYKDMENEDLNEKDKTCNWKTLLWEVETVSEIEM